jgi:hypothetical protein
MAQADADEFRTPLDTENKEELICMAIKNR